MNETKSKQEWLKRASLFNDIADKVKADNMWVGYHAHAMTSSRSRGNPRGTSSSATPRPKSSCSSIPQLLGRRADPVAGADKYPNRARTIHLKPTAADPKPSSARTRWIGRRSSHSARARARLSGTSVEHETGKDPLDAVKRNFEALKKLGKV